MNEACYVFGQVFRGGTATLLARIIGNAGAAIVPADIASIEYTCYQARRPEGKLPPPGRWA